MEDKYSAKKYFIFKFKSYITNDNKILAKKYFPSVREILRDYILIHEDISNSRELEKLSHARTDLLKAVKFFVQHSIFIEDIVYKNELNHFIQQINDIEKSKEDKKTQLLYTRLYNTCKSLYNKFNTINLYSNIIEMIKEMSKYIKVDIALEIMVSELLFEGYSLKYLDEWYNKNIGNKQFDEKTIDEVLDVFKELKRPLSKYTYYLSLLERRSVNSTELHMEHGLKVIKEDYEQLSLVGKDGKDDKTFLIHNDDYSIYRVEEVWAMDEYKGLEIVLNALNSYFHLIDYLNTLAKSPIQKKAIIVKEEGCMKVNINPFDFATLFSSIERREQKDIEDFINYRERVYKQNVNSQEISNMQRAFNIVKGQNDQLPENRLINLWADLEYILTFHEGDSIISKVKDIIPKLICLYIIKDKLNIFWKRLNNDQYSEIPIVKEFKEKCRREDDYHYDIKVLTELIIGKDEILIEEFGFNDLLKRGIAEIGEFLTKSDSRTKYIEQKHDEITYDIIRLYRVRNILIHSANNNIINLDHKALRLYHYTNSLLGVIIYYKNKNIYSTIAEILNSIEYTYKEYLNILGSKQANPIDICTPKYLYIG